MTAAHAVVVVAALLLVTAATSSRPRPRRLPGTPAPEFAAHIPVTPRLFDPRRRERPRVASSSKESRPTAHLDDLSLEVHDGLLLELKLNGDLIPENYFQRYHDESVRLFCVQGRKLP